MIDSRMSTRSKETPSSATRWNPYTTRCWGIDFHHLDSDARLKLVEELLKSHGRLKFVEQLDEIGRTLSYRNHDHRRR